MPFLRKWLIGLAIFIVIFTLVGFFGLPPLLKGLLVKKLSEALHREVTISEIKVDPFALSLTVRDLAIKEPSSPLPFVSFESLFLNLESASIWKKALILREIRLTRPHIQIIQRTDRSYNFSDLLVKKEPKKQKQKQKQAKPFLFSLNNIRVTNGSIDFFDQPKQTKHTLRDLNVALPFLSNIAYFIDQQVQPEFSVKVNGTPFFLRGRTKPFADSRETEFAVNITNFNIPYYLSYVPMQMNFNIPSGFLNARLTVAFIQPKLKKPSLRVKGDVILRDLLVEDKSRSPLLRIPQLDVSATSIEPFSKIIHLSRVSFQSPQLALIRDRGGVLNLQTLIPQKREAQSQAERGEGGAETGTSTPLSFEIDEVELTGGRTTFSDFSPTEPFKTAFDPMDLKIAHFSNRPNSPSTLSLALKTEANESLELEGTFSIDPLRIDGTAEIKSIPLKRYSPYYRERILFAIEDGRLGLSTRYSYAKGEGEPTISLSGLSASLRDLRLKRSKESQDFLKIPLLSIKGTEVDLPKRTLSVGEVFTARGKMSLTRGKDGKVNVSKLLPPPTPPVRQPVQSKPRSQKEERPWLFRLQKILVEGYTIQLEDDIPSPPVAIAVKDLKVGAKNISTAKNAKASMDLSFSLDKGGTFSMTGTAGIDPLLADLRIDLKRLAIGPFQPYFTKQVKIAVTSGALSVGGDLQLNHSKEHGLRATYRGDASLVNFASIEKAGGEDLLKWGSLAVSGIKAQYSPFNLTSRGISLADFYARVTVNSDRTLNLQHLVEKGEPGKESAPPPERKAAKPAAGTGKGQEGPGGIGIQVITLQGGRIEFADRSINPTYSMKLTEVGGRISGLSSVEASPAEIDLKGRLDDYAPLEITGKISPLRDKLFVDLKVQFKDMELSSVTPYSGKYMGYTIQKGKLSFDLRYLIDKRKLDSQNIVFLDQLTLGDQVESPQATKLPLKLAIALLKDRKGEIKLDLPVSGSLDDPKFRIWGVILQVIVNLITKAATSPFALLGAVIGGGEELSYVEFDEGSTAVSEANLEKLEALGKALYDRPSLKLDIEGHVDSEKDREGLRQSLFHRRVKAQKLNEMVRKGAPATPVDEIVIEPEEYEKYLRMAYKGEKFPKPRNILGLQKKLPVPEMEKLMLTHTEIKEDDLRTLASQRAMNVKDLIVKSGQIEPERIFIIEPKSLSGPKKEKLKESRVDLSLK